MLRGLANDESQLEVINDGGTVYFDEMDLEMQRNAQEMIARLNVNGGSQKLLRPDSLVITFPYAIRGFPHFIIIGYLVPEHDPI